MAHSKRKRTPREAKTEIPAEEQKKLSAPKFRIIEGGIPVVETERHYGGDADEDGVPGMDYGV